MLNIWRLRNVLRKLETSENLAKILIQTATAIAGILDKKYLVAVQLEKHTKMTASTKTMTPQMKINPTSLTKTNTSSKHHSDVDVAVTELPVPVPVTTETKATYTEQVEQTEKRIKAATFNVSLFSQTVSNGGVVEKESGCGSFRKHNVLIDHQNYGYGTSQARDTQNQTNYKMSDAKINEVTQQDGEAAPKQLDEEPSCNGASCGSEDNKQKQNGKEKPCFNSSLADILHFMELVGNLKHTKRTGWVLRDVNDCESISGHMYRMSMMTFLLEEGEGLNRIRCMELALVHDLAESLVGDLTPFCGVAKEDKKAMELKAMADICKLIEPRGKRIMELFEEYEEGQSAESKFVKDLDRLDMVMQAFEYEKRDNCLMKHQEFFDSTEGKFQHPFVKKLVKEICDQRKAIVEAKLIGNGDLKYETVTPNCPPCLEHKNERS